MNQKIDFDEVYREFHPKIVHYVSRLAGPDEAEDIAQETFEKISRSLGDFRAESKLSTWIYRIATHTAIDRLRSAEHKRATVQRDLEDADNPEAQSDWIAHKPTPSERTVIRKEMSECVIEFIDNLPEDYRAVIVLSELEGFANKEVADVLNISLENAKARLHRARAKLREMLNEGCNFYHNEDNVLACDRKPSQILPKAPE